MDSEKDLNMEENTSDEGVDDMVKVKGHYRCIKSKKKVCQKKVRVKSHRRRLPTKRWRLFR